MKKISISFILLALYAIVFCSCDSNKGKIEEITNLFISAVNNKDKASFYSIFPEAKNITNMSITDSIAIGKVSVEKIDSFMYVATIANARIQKLVFNAKDEKSIVMIDSYSVLELDSAALELAIQTGVPVKEISDLNISKLMDMEGDYITYLNMLYAESIKGGLVKEDGTYVASRNYGGSVTVNQSIRNNGDVPIKGNEYNIEFRFYCPNGSAASRKVIEPGVDLEPNEATTITVFPGSGYVNACYNHDFGWEVSVTYKNLSPITTLLKYVKFTGKEYDEFIKNEDSKKTEKISESNNPYAWLSERLATEDDLVGKSKLDLKIMRNTIFAMHGYIFKTKDMKEYFSKQPWYKPQKENVNSELSSIENKNIQFLKKHE